MPVTWRLANSLVTLRDQVDASYPNRSKASDGTIGDTSHASGASDHNPNSAGVVTALDLTHSPQTGFDVHALADRLRVNRHPNLKYIISNSRIAGDWTGWKWVAYTGSNPHDKHAHFSVGRGSDGRSTPPYDDTTKWNIKGETPVATKPIHIATKADVITHYKGVYDQVPTAKNIAYYTTRDISWLYHDLAYGLKKRYDELVKTPPTAVTLKKGIYEVK